MNQPCRSAPMHCRPHGPLAVPTEPLQIRVVPSSSDELPAKPKHGTLVLQADRTRLLLSRAVLLPSKIVRPRIYRGPIFQE
jgi:hypothetical protein